MPSTVVRRVQDQESCDLARGPLVLGHEAAPDVDLGEWRVRVTPHHVPALGEAVDDDAPQHAAAHVPGAYRRVGTGRRVVHRADLYLVPVQPARRVDDQRPDAGADVEHDRALTGRRQRVMVVHPGRHDGLLKPSNGIGRYGKCSSGLAFTSLMLRPCWTAVAAASGLNFSSTSGTVAPAMARSEIDTTSSAIRRPFGKPATSPPIT